MNVRVTERCEKSCKSQNGEGHNDGCKENEIIHVQRLKSVKLYNNPMDETTSAEMKINDEDPKRRANWGSTTAAATRNRLRCLYP